MDFELKTLTAARICTEKTNALVVLIPDGARFGDDPVSRLAAHACKSGDFETKTGKILSAYRVEGVAASRLLLVGVGDASLKSVRSAVTAAMASLKAGNTERATVYLGALASLSGEMLRTAVVACSDALYSYALTKSKPTPVPLKRVSFAVEDMASVKEGYAMGLALVRGIELAKEWGNRPANHATPTMLAGAAKELAKLPRIKAEILGPKEVAKLGMGAFMAVSQGSAEPLRFIVLRYEGAAKTQAPVVLVGKGITFDTGGISLKPAPEMDEMKFDMCGAASVLGTFRTLAELQPALNVVGLIPTCENMPGSRAIKPGDVVTCMNGQTIEILNTDAEGRLILSDALAYAGRFKPRAIVDIATLTGACVIALGGVRSGMFSNDDALADALARSGDDMLDPCWRMPLDDEYAEGLKSNFADVANVAGRPGGSITAAKFLQRFAGDFSWAHLDVAGTASKGGAAKGATGRPVALLVNYLLGQVQAPVAGKASAKKPVTKKAKPVVKPQA